jgi:P-type Ca2+ transporter type 2C
MSNWYNKDQHAVMKMLTTNESSGLTSEVALKKQVDFGKNEFDKAKNESLVSKILHQIKDISTIILLIAVALSFVLAIKEGSGFLEPLVILSIVIINIVLAITQESSAEKSLEALINMNTPTCLVLRDGIQKQIDSADLVPGDIVILRAGDFVPADGRLLKAVDLHIDESSLTGESEASEKSSDSIEQRKVGIGDQSNMVFSGCHVTAGNGVCVITETGMNTEMGKIAGYLNNTQKIMTPLQLRLNKLGKIISLVAIMSAIILFAVGLLRGESVWYLIMMAVSLAVAAVPETLALIVTLSLSNGVKKMVDKKSIIRKLSAVETLGSTSVICSDKTGTLTQNQMTVMKLWSKSEKAISVDDTFSDKQLHMLEQLSLASNATIETDEQGNKHIIGDATEKAILKLMDLKGRQKEDVAALWPRVKEIPFSSSRKRMTTIHKDPEGGYLVLSKGALDWMPLLQDIEEKKTTIQIHDSFTEDALRVIAIAQKHIDTLPEDDDLETVENELKLIGLIGIIDPPRPESKSAIAAAKKAGIRTVMITGDHISTATAIAKDIGLLNDGEKVITGEQLSEMSDEELCNSIHEYSVYARVTPEDKIRIVEAWQENDEVVVMTGDGVNDAPALKAADVGVAMGKNGTEVAKNAADMILVDDNFASIVDAVHEGRNVFSNIRKTIYFLLVCNISEIIIMLGAQLIGWKFPVTPVMLLLINVLGDGIPGICLAKEVSDSRIMTRKPIGRNESFFNRNLTQVIIRQTIICSAIVLVGYYLGTYIVSSDNIVPSHEVGQSMSFLILGWSSILHVFTVRSRKSIIHYKMKQNMPMVYSSITMIIAFALIVLIPGFGNIFGIKPIGPMHWLIVVGLSVLPIIVAEIGKFIDNYGMLQQYKRRSVEHRELDI